MTIDETKRVGASNAATDEQRRLSRMFNVSTIVSGIRCTISYLILPFAAPFLGLAPSVGPVLGLTIGAVALAANVYSIRRFWTSGHRLRKPVTVVHIGIIGLLVALAIGDIRALT